MQGHYYSSCYRAFSALARVLLFGALSGIACCCGVQGGCTGVAVGCFLYLLRIQELLCGSIGAAMQLVKVA